MKYSLYAVVLFFVIPFTAHAFGPPSENGFVLSIGPGGAYSPKYTGSDKSKLEFLPYVEISYTHDWIKPFVSVADGAGIKIISQKTGLFSSCGIDFGESRKLSDNRRLEGTGEINNLFRYFFKVGIETEPFDFVLSANYFRIKSEYEKDVRNKTYNAFIFSPRFITGYPVLDSLVVQLETGISLMNSSFAEAYHGVRYDTAYYSKYDASAGFRDVYSEMTLVFMPLDCITIIAQGRCTYLLGDAGCSQLTEKRRMCEAKAFITYSIFP